MRISYSLVLFVSLSVTASASLENVFNFDTDSLRQSLDRIKTVAEHLKDKAVELNAQKDKLVAEKTSDLKDALNKVVAAAGDHLNKVRSKRDVGESNDVQKTVQEAKSALNQLKDVLTTRAKDISVKNGLKSLDAVEQALDHVENKLVPQARDHVDRFGNKLDNHVRENKKKLVDFLDFLEQKYFELREHSNKLADNLFERKRQALGHLRNLIQRVRSRVQNNRSKRGTNNGNIVAMENVWEEIARVFEQLEREAKHVPTIAY